jgi:ATP-dependent RNA helicase DeaD
MATAFEELHIQAGLIELLKQRGIAQPTPIQERAIPSIIEGKDVLAQSQTGTGKTLAYLLPILEKADSSSKEVQAVVLVPTQELGMQIFAEMETYGKPFGFRAQSLIGGASLQRQIEKLRQHPHLVVGTPGRILELIKLRKLKVHQVQTVVVDEADQVFELGSKSEVEEVLKSMLRSRQLLFFSATVTDAIRQTAEQWMKEPLLLLVEPEKKVAAALTHESILTVDREKIDTLRKLIRLLKPASALVFVNDTDIVGEIVAKLQFAGLEIEAIYGDATKQDRAKVMTRFREGRLKLLLATDVAARGLDIRGLTHVINFDPPPDAEHYVHRAGRTGRMGKPGSVVTMVTPQQVFILRKLEKRLGINIHPKAMSYGQWIDAGSAAARQAPKGRPNEHPDARDNRRSPEGSAEQERSRPARAADSARKPAAQSDLKPAPREAKRASTAQPAGTRSKRTLSEQERKNKGAPRWLKEKRSTPPAE